MPPIDLTYGQRESCVVCGAPEGNCGPMDGHDDRPGKIQFQEWAPEYQPEPRRDQVDDVIVTEKVYEKLPIPHSKRTREVLRYRPGDRIPHDEAVRLGVIEATPPAEPEAQADVQPEAPKVPPALQKAARAKRTAQPRKAAAKTTKATKKA